MRDVSTQYTVVCCCPPNCIIQPAQGEMLLVQRLKTDGKDAFKFLRLVCTEGEGLVYPLCVCLNGGGASSSGTFLVVNFKGFSMYKGNLPIDLA